MAYNALSNVKVAILATDGFEQDELEQPRSALDAAGAQTTIVSPKTDRVRGWKYTDWGRELPVDLPLEDARADDFDALLLPGGVISPDKLRAIPQAVRFVRAFFDAGKPVAAICHGPWMIVEADCAHGRQMTSWPSVRSDLRNAGAQVQDAAVVRDGNLVTSRKPDDIPAFNRAIIELFSRHGAPA
jgi:protease I